MIPLSNIESADAQAQSLAEISESLESATAYSYEWSMESGGVDNDAIYCPMTRKECMGSNCAAAARDKYGMWRCMAYGGKTIVERSSGNRARR